MIGAAARAEAARLTEHFEKAGALRVDADILQPAGTLLDLYGEDIRARAYVTQDPLLGERMLRPDFTVPVVQMHMQDGAEPARYTYCGEVFRRQEQDTGRPSEFLQVGYEIFDRKDPVGADAEVFLRIAAALEGVETRAAIGDIGLITAAVSGLATTERRRAALMRHIWRPRRFRALLDRFAGRAPARPPVPGTACVAPHIGLRGPDEIAARIEALREDARTPPIPARQVELLSELLDLRDRAPAALGRLGDIAVDMPVIAPAVRRMEMRLEALERGGIDIDALGFEASYGRTSLEYYDGFVFGFSRELRPDLPPLATGGRYDALTRVLGAGRSIPAVGGVVRPGLLADLRKDAS